MTLATLAAALLFLAPACAPSSEQKPIAAVESGLGSARLFQEKNVGMKVLRQTMHVALTFDDGPKPGVTDVLLDLLKKENIRATFFVLGQNVRPNDPLLKRMRDEGHVIGNHSYSHARLSEDGFVDDPAKLVEEILRTHKKIAAYQRPGSRLYFRAPFGAWRPEHADQLNALPELRSYIGPVYWTAGGDMEYTKDGQIKTAADWACWSTRHNASVLDCATAYYREVTARGGGVMLMHDRDLRTVEMTAQLIEWLKAEGYGFVTLDEVTSYEAYK